MTTADLISVMVDRIVTQFHPLRIILFGSQARGDANESSDVDLMVVLNDIPNRYTTTSEILHSLSDVPISKDIIVVTPNEIERDANVIGTISYDALHEGRIMYEKNNPRVKTVALLWLRHSSDDLMHALHMLKTAPRSFPLVCYLCQQSAEKSIKASLVLEQIRFPHIHDLRILCDLLPDEWAVKKKRVKFSKLSSWRVNARYPGDWPTPTCEDAVEAEATARLIYDSVAEEFKRRGVLV